MKRYTYSMWFVLLVVMALAFCLSSCSSSGSSSTSSENGELVISLTDAPGDFANYTVDVQSLTLTKANGAIVETLPLSTRIDFSQYTEMTEFLTAATISSGLYTSATLTLNYENAEIWVENESGENVEVTTIVDGDGNPVTELEVSVQLAKTSRLLIAPGTPAHLSLDFDLKASNAVTFDEDGIPSVTVEPSLIAALEPETIKDYRIRGPLTGVNTDENYFEVCIRPFFHNIKSKNINFGSMQVSVSDETVYDINGNTFTGSDGLVEMDGLVSLTAVIAIGDLEYNPLRFEATEVRAGSSVEGGTLDVITGNVTGRTGDELTVKGATLIREDGSVIFNDTVIVLLAETTLVKKQLSDDTFTIDDISIGQKVSIFGTLTSETVTQLEMDATEGYARMLLTTVRGNITNLDTADQTAQLTMDMQTIDNKKADMFDYTGTGTDIENDADPSDYEIHTGALSLSGLETGSPVKVRGFVQSFGQAPADFNARTIINVQSMAAFLKVKWHPPTADAFTEISSAGLTLNLDDASMFHHLGRGSVVVNLKNYEEAPVIKAEEDGGIFSIKLRSSLQVFNDFSGFTENLSEYLANGSKVNKLFATGKFEDTSSTLTTDNIYIQLQ